MTRGPLCIAVTGAIGLTTEAVAAVKDHRAKKNGDTDKEKFSTGEGGMVNHVKEETTTKESQTFTPESLMATAVTWGKIQGLELPVIIPQRRPRTRSRGWLRGYAPALGGCQIDQDMFFSFLEGFDAEIKVRNPLFHWIQVSFDDPIETRSLHRGQSCGERRSYHGNIARWTQSLRRRGCFCRTQHDRSRTEDVHYPQVSPRI